MLGIQEKESELETYLALLERVQARRREEQALYPRIPETYHGSLRLIADGLKWLEAIGHAHWRSGLLSEKAWVQWALEDRSAALTNAAEAYRIQKAHDGPGISLGSLAGQTAHFARSLGEIELAVTILAETEVLCEDPIQRLRLLHERVRTLAACQPPRLEEALVLAREGIQRAEALEDPFELLTSRGLLGKVSAQTGQFAEAQQILEQVQQTVFEAEPHQRPPLLTNAALHHWEVLRVLETQPEPEAALLRDRVEGWVRELGEEQDRAAWG